MNKRPRAGTPSDSSDSLHTHPQDPAQRHLHPQGSHPQGSHPHAKISDQDQHRGAHHVHVARTRQDIEAEIEKIQSALLRWKTFLEGARHIGEKGTQTGRDYLDTVLKNIEHQAGRLKMHPLTVYFDTSNPGPLKDRAQTLKSLYVSRGALSQLDSEAFRELVETAAKQFTPTTHETHEDDPLWLLKIDCDNSRIEAYLAVEQEVRHRARLSLA